MTSFRDLLPVVQLTPPMRAGKKMGGCFCTILTTTPTSHMPTHNTHWKNMPGRGRKHLNYHVLSLVLIMHNKLLSANKHNTVKIHTHTYRLQCHISLQG